ncbi:MAG: alkene reductase [Gammaproteobacteria bacterium]|nr:alkene reductase [Gammaproteobacteria bacterium]
MKIFNQYKLGDIKLNNHLVMAPMTRSRAIDNIPNDLMAEYYRLRAAAGLIITEGVAPSANGLGYPRIPGIYNQAQIEGWKKVTDAVHVEGGKIFIQLMHTGRVSHPENMEPNTRVLAPSAIGMSGEMWTDSKGKQAYPEPLEMTLLDIEQTQEEYVEASKKAIEAGFDGVELHGANGYLIDQFINTASNKRQDEYGGSSENRCRFALEVANKVSQAIGAQRTGIRLSPYGVFNDMEIFEGVEETYEYLAGELGKLNLLYIHIVDHSSQGAPEVKESVKSKIRDSFGRDIIASGGLDREKAENILSDDRGDLVAFGQAFLANPDLVYKLENDLPLNNPDFDTFYTPGEKGYVDYPMAPK